MDKAKKQKVLDILSYWELMEFLEQENIEFQDKKTAEAVFELVKNNKPIKNMRSLEVYHFIGEKLGEEVNIDDFFEIYEKPSGELLAEDIEKIKKTDIEGIPGEDSGIFEEFKYRSSEYRFFMGILRRNDIVEHLKQYLSEEERKLEELLPELPYQDDESIAWFAFATDGEGKYKEKSFELSPILWALTEWNNNRDCADRFGLDMDKYRLVSAKYDKYIAAVTANKGKAKPQNFLPEIYKKIYGDYVRPLFPKALNNIRHIGFFKYERSKTPIAKDKNTSNALGNSFYLKDITNLKKQIDEGFFGERSDYERSVISYILSADNKRTGKETAGRILISPKENTDHSFRLFTDILDIENAPNGKWPAHFMPSLMQQTAINLAISKERKLPVFSVNGPPGTGKTTLLKEVLANNIVERAYLLAAFAGDEPDSVFEEQLFEQGPLEEKDKSYIASAPHYFKIKKEFDEINDYGMLVTSCNNSAVENITVDLPKLDDVLGALVKRDRKTKEDISPPELKEIHDLFDPSLTDDILFTKYSDALLNMSDEEGKSKKEKEKIKTWGLISAPLGKRKNIISYCEAVLKPFLEEYGADGVRTAHLAAYRGIREKFLKQYEYVRELKKELKRVCRDCAAAPDSFVLPEKYKDKMSVIDGEFIRAYASQDEDIEVAAQLSNPWATDKFNRERERLFFYACKLHKEFIASSECMLGNMRNLLVAWGIGGTRMASRDSYKAFPVLLQSLFLLTPVISATFASVGTFLSNASRGGIIGMLIVDEAGQAPPHVAAGALYRCRKAVIVGDPKQIEPVVTAETDMFKRIMTADILAAYKDKRISVQGFADHLNPYGTYLGRGSEREWVGCPLVVHRRCTDPMYSISNKLSYDETMKNDSRKPDTDDKYILPESCWINVSGTETGSKNHYVKEQGEVVLKLLEAMLKKTGGVQRLYIISPFTSVVRGVRNEIQKSVLYNNPKVRAWLGENNIGTVHTFQGKGTDEVIFLLGCDKNSVSAANWVNKNIVNVAATRAKKRFYVIGDKTVWKGCEPVAAAEEIIGCTFAAGELGAKLYPDEPKNEVKPEARFSTELIEEPAAMSAAKPVAGGQGEPQRREEPSPPFAPQRANNGQDRLMICPECGSPIREYKNKATGQKFWSCSNFKNCDFKPRCKCGKPMTLKSNGKTGEKFWGCTGYSSAPDSCKFTCRFFTKQP